MNYLIIDDDVDDQEIFALALKRLNKPANVITAKDGIEALEIVTGDKTFVPDCIFLDLNMPRMGGKDCLVEMRKLPWLKNVPIVIYSTSSQDSDRHETQKLGATDFVSKEWDINRLKLSLSSLFNRHRI